MPNQKTIPEKIFDVLNYTFLVLLSVLTTYPIIHVIMASFSDSTTLLAHHGLLLWPVDFTLVGYQEIFRNQMVAIGYRNTLFIIVVGTALSIFITAITAYALSRKDLFFKKYIMLMFIFTMYFSGGLIPYYLTIKQLDLLNNILALIIPSAINTYNLIIMKTSFEGIPYSLEESARLDGANEFVILFRIVLPLSMPVIAVMILYYGVSYWNAWFNATLFIQDRNLYPLQLVLREIVILSDTSMQNGMTLTDITIDISETMKYTVIVVATIPILFVYPFLQKYFVKGVMIGAVKG